MEIVHLLIVGCLVESRMGEADLVANVRSKGSISTIWVESGGRSVTGTLAQVQAAVEI